MPAKSKPRKTVKKRPFAQDFTGVESLTHQSFKDECDVNNVIKRFTRTGQLTHVNQRPAQYGDAPEQSFFEASCIASEAASALEDRAMLPPDETENVAEKGSEDVSEAKSELSRENDVLPGQLTADTNEAEDSAEPNDLS